MAKSNNNVVTYGLQGLIGNMLVFKQVNGKTVVAQRPKKSLAPPTTVQLNTQSRFKEAAAYAKNAIADTDLRAFYTNVAKKGQSAYNVAFADYFKAPEVSNPITDQYTGQIGQILKVQATDNVQVVSVLVQILLANGTVLEEGQATSLINGLDWQYACSQENSSIAGSRVVFKATDTAGNETVLSITLN